MSLALVTGGARRLGATIAAYLHGRGFDVIVHVRQSRDDGAALVEELNGRRPGSAELCVVDLAAPEAVGGLAAVVGERPLALLVNNASQFVPQALGTVTAEGWSHTLDTNLGAPFLLVQVLADALRRGGGSVVNLTDAAPALPDYVPYAVSKLALEELTRLLALRLAPTVRVNAVAPGAILWPEGAADWDAGQRQAFLAQIPLERLGREDDIAAAVGFLADASYITGQVLCVDGGLRARQARGL